MEAKKFEFEIADEMGVSEAERLLEKVGKMLCLAGSSMLRNGITPVNQGFAMTMNAAAALEQGSRMFTPQPAQGGGLAVPMPGTRMPR